MAIEKEPKPKKAFRMEFIIWDDGEITKDLVEYIQGERGAPKQWRAEPSDFVKSVAGLVGDKTKVFLALVNAMDIAEEDLKTMFVVNTKPQEKKSALPFDE